MSIKTGEGCSLEAGTRMDGAEGGSVGVWCVSLWDRATFLTRANGKVKRLTGTFDT